MCVCVCVYIYIYIYIYIREREREGQKSSVIMHSFVTLFNKVFITYNNNNNNNALFNFKSDFFRF